VGATLCPRCPVRTPEARKLGEDRIACEGGFNQCAFDIASIVPGKETRNHQSENIPSSEESHMRPSCTYLPIYRTASAITPRPIEFIRAIPL